MAVSSKVDLTVSGVLRRYNEDGTSKFIPEYGRLEITADTDVIDFGVVSFDLLTPGYSVHLPWQGYVDGTETVKGGPYSSVSNGFNANIYPPEYSHFIWNHPVSGNYRVDDYKNSNDFYRKNVLDTCHCPDCGHLLFPWHKKCDKCGSPWPGDEDKMAESNASFSLDYYITGGDPIRYKNLPEVYTMEGQIFWSL